MFTTNDCISGVTQLTVKQLAKLMEGLELHMFRISSINDSYVEIDTTDTSEHIESVNGVAVETEDDGSVLYDDFKEAVEFARDISAHKAVVIKTTTGNSYIVTNVAIEAKYVNNARPSYGLMANVKLY